MRYNIITPAEVVALAFSDGGYIVPTAIAEEDIDAAIERWVKPIVGEALLEAVQSGGYAEFCHDLLMPAIAFCVRREVQPRLNASTSQLGLAAAVGGTVKAADKSLREELMRAVKVRARTALKSMSDYLEAHATEFREYDTKHNVLNRCSCDGGFVQIF
jgi:hypothetical protein